MAEALLEREIIFQSDLVGLIGERPFAKLTTYQEYMDKEDEPEAKDEEVSEENPEIKAEEMAKKTETKEEGSKEEESPEEASPA